MGITGVVSSKAGPSGSSIGITGRGAGGGGGGGGGRGSSGMAGIIATKVDCPQNLHRYTADERSMRPTQAWSLRMDAKISLGEPRVLVSREALLHNASVVRRAVGPGVRVCAMIKADAYGHGADIVADTLANFSTKKFEAPLVDALAVASIDEAEQLPATILPVYVLRPVENCFLGRQRSRIEQAIRMGWVMTVCSSSAADDVARIATSIGKRASVQVMIDTGMTRSGVSPEELGDVLETVRGRTALRLVGMLTHFSCAEDAGGEVTGEQLGLFNSTIDGFKELIPPKVLRHAANSAAVFFRPEAHLDMVRPGIALYGIDPTLTPSHERPLKPA